MFTTFRSKVHCQLFGINNIKACDVLWHFCPFCSFTAFKVSLCKDELSVVVVTVIIGFVRGQSSWLHSCEVRNFGLCGKINQHKIVPTFLILRKKFVARGIKSINSQKSKEWPMIPNYPHFLKNSYYPLSPDYTVNHCSLKRINFH